MNKLKQVGEIGRNEAVYCAMKDGSDVEGECLQNSDQNSGAARGRNLG